MPANLYKIYNANRDSIQYHLQTPTPFFFGPEQLGWDPHSSLRWNQELNRLIPFVASLFDAMLVCSSVFAFDDKDVDVVAMVESSSLVGWKPCPLRSMSDMSSERAKVSPRDCGEASKANLWAAEACRSLCSSAGSANSASLSLRWECSTMPSWIAWSKTASCRTSRFRAGGNSGEFATLLCGAKAMSWSADKLCKVAATSSATSLNSSWRMYRASWSAAWAPCIDQRNQACWMERN